MSHLRQFAARLFVFSAHQQTSLHEGRDQSASRSGQSRNIGQLPRILPFAWQSHPNQTGKNARRGGLLLRGQLVEDLIGAPGNRPRDLADGIVGGVSE